ncbi:hypothetical protein PIB30_053744 [Stylosanthes scabra]|uniref:Uncharacterized protein n=1 Tax=Stylosanthes scabra TaxID=79078 RepID=A0ABU6ZHE2_9FABA|nr:hypothetical protein [Stylosanthes scabra]
MASIGHVWTVSLTWPKLDIHKGKGSLASPPHITFGLRFLPSPNVTHAAKLTLVTFLSRFGLAKTRLKHDQHITLPKLTQANFEQARSCLNILKISSQAYTPSSQV